jgi:hypothetical protein
MNYAIIDSATNLVANVIVWDGKPPWQPPSGCIAVLLRNNAGIGWSYIDEQFVEPAIEEITDDLES